MKKLGLLLILMAVSASSFAQYNFSAFQYVTFEEAEDYTEALPRVESAVKYLLETPQDPQDVDALYAMQFLMRWMGGTPDYTYSIESFGVKLMNKKNVTLFGVYLASMVDFSLKFPEEHKSDDMAASMYAAKFLGEYCSKEENNVKQTKPVKKLIEAYQNDSLEEYIRKQ